MKAEKPDILFLIKSLEEIRRVIFEKERSFPESFFEKLHPTHRKSARNLIHYLSLRLFDLREIQEQLSTLGLSSLSHSERYTLVNINNILYLLYNLAGKNQEINKATPEFTFNYPEGRKRLQENTTAIFRPARRGSRIMVTLPPEAADDYNFVLDMVKSGMNVARINCSHEDEKVWEKMIINVRKAAADSNSICLVYMDLPGPRLRTGPVESNFSEKSSNEKKKGPGLRLFTGDSLFVYKKKIPGKQAQRDHKGKLLKPAQISVSLPEIWKDLKEGEMIHFNEGKISGKIKEITPEYMEVIITNAKPEKGSLLRGDKGINLPETSLELPSLTANDLKILPFVCQHADMLGYSFVRKPRDVKRLRAQLQKLRREDLPIILKIENRQAFSNLPKLLLECMQSRRYGIMLARGDLALEVGFARIAEVQEQILWLCDAAHVPVIWATQVLENLVKKGLASRAEITDAAMSVRAECVMLNKGPFVKEAVEILANIDERMTKHMFKKHGALRPLNVAKHFFERS